MVLHEVGGRERMAVRDRVLYIESTLYGTLNNPSMNMSRTLCSPLSRTVYIDHRHALHI